MKSQLVYFFFAVILVGCGPEKETPAETTGKVKFTIETAATTPEGGRLAETVEPAYIRISLIDETGQTRTDLIEVYAISGNFFSYPYPLPSGQYTLQEFVVMDSQQEILYITPLEGSPLATYVVHPLPLSVSVTTNEVSVVPLQVLSVAEQEPTAFGYSEYQFKPLKLREVPVYVSQLQGMQTDGFSYSLEVVGTDTTSQTSWSKIYELTNPQTIRVPIGYDQYKITARAEGFVPQIKFFRSDFFYSDLATIEELTFELIPANSPDVIVLEDDGFKFFISADPCLVWGRVEIPEELVFKVDFIRWYKIGVDADDEYVGEFLSPGGLIGYPALMTNFDNIYWERPFVASENYCELYLDEEYRDQLELVTLEKGLLLDFDWDGTETALEDYDVHLIHAY